MPYHSKHTVAAAHPARQPVPDSDADADFASAQSDEETVADEPMTDAQATTLKRLCEEANEPQAFDGELTKAEADAAITDMRQRVGSQH